MTLTNEQYATLAAELADLPTSGETCPDRGDPSPGGAKCAACREWDNEHDAFLVDVLVSAGAAEVAHGSS
jgi:hypothetical protein